MPLSHREEKKKERKIKGPVKWKKLPVSLPLSIEETALD